MRYEARVPFSAPNKVFSADAYSLFFCDAFHKLHHFQHLVEKFLNMRSRLPYRCYAALQIVPEAMI